MPLSLQDVANIAQVVAAIGVIVSLLYLAAQVRQKTRALKASAYREANDSAAAFQSLLVESPGAAELFLKGLADRSDLTEAERFRFETSMQIMFQIFDNLFFQHGQRMIDDATWSRTAATVRVYLSQPGVVAWWRSKQLPFSPGFAGYVENEIASLGS